MVGTGDGSAALAVSSPDAAAEFMPVEAVKVLYATTTGTARRFAESVRDAVAATGLAAEALNLMDYDAEELPDETAVRGRGRGSLHASILVRGCQCNIMLCRVLMRA